MQTTAFHHRASLLFRRTTEDADASQQKMTNTALLSRMRNPG